MKEKKHIDALFKEQLQNYEAAPSPAVWNHIQAELKKEKEDRKVIPIWWKLGGVAAVIALLLTVGNIFINPSNSSIDKTIVTEENQVKTQKDGSIINEQKDVLVDSNISEKEKQQMEDEKTQEDSQHNPSKGLQNNIYTPSSNNNRVAIEDKKQENTTETPSTFIKKDATVSSIIKKEAIANIEDIKDNNIHNDQDKLEQNHPLIKKELSSGLGVDAKETIVVAGDNKTQQNSSIEEAKQDINPLIKNDPAENSQIKEAVTIAETEEIKQKDPIKEENKGKSIFDAIEESKEAAVAKTEATNSGGWEVTPNVGPVFYNSLGEGSSIDASFADNSQSSDTNISYGVQISYNINDRLSVRSGVSNVNLGYSTGDIELGTAPIEVALQSVNFDGGSRVLSAFDKGTLASLPPPNSEDPLSFVTPKSTGGNAELIQNLSYYEVPMELNYALVNNRFGINMIGGFSTLFLGNNEVSVQDGDFKEVLGEANNLNSVSFTTNVGLGFNYKISKRLKFNIEPMFKYQLNPYTDSSVDFKPYYVGIYSGLSLKF